MLNESNKLDIYQIKDYNVDDIFIFFLFDDNQTYFFKSY
jgi:hypothetical protein